MSPAQHYFEAEKALEEARLSEDDALSNYWLRRAQVHAVLANARDVYTVHRTATGTNEPDGSQHT